ncbi:MAG: hypothetical protein J7559_16340 [Cohnella sp.]|nr:hypothetical protein [Cohnella sp.]
MRREAWFPVAILLALFILTDNHVGRSLGDAIFETVGISPWSEGERTGVHRPVFIGLPLLFIGMIGTVKFYKPRYPRIVSRLVIGYVLFIILYPQAAERTTMLLLHNTEGFRSIDYVKEESHCSFRSEEDKVIANCSFTMYNYGNEEEITIKPILSDEYGIRFEARTLSIRKHEKNNFGTWFEGTQNENTGFHGSSRRIGAEIQLNGITKRFE